MNSYGITTKDRTIMFRVRAVSKSIKGEWSNGIYVTPSVYYATPAPTPTPSPTPSQTPDVLGLTVQGIWSGPDSKMSSSYGWQWAAVKVTNKSSRSIMPSSWFTTSFVSPQGVSVDSNMDSFPTLLPGASGWLASTIHNPDAVGNVFLSTSGTLKASAISLTELPTVSNVVFTPAGSGGVATATIKNNSNMFLYKATHTNVVFLNSAGIPVYAYWGTIGASIAPGATARVNLPAFLGENLSFTPSGFTSVEVSLGVWLCDADSSFANCRW
jgi:hypothetical protein